MNWAAVDFTGLANAFLAVLVAALGWAAVAIGRRAKPAVEARPAAAVEMQGAAIISNEPLMMLIRAIEAGNVTKMEETALKRKEVDALGELTDELKELRFELRQRR